ncbi:cytochrome P450 CYP749A22 isoform X1 [Ziziphus jujuba]|uniref:Cytochrome P450 CYP749A22 isoform X1 n=1 Tax=Ziziphus jujuba TaxID=326968 RepID=A0A6P4ADP8_ZIZJJ|nr:cytochrome P450 CYP749A22 isoform X1 [Ziziphus jujuba]
MSSLGDLLVIFSTFLVLFLVLALIKIFHKLWWIPSRIQYLMVSQGIKGPSYRFMYGSTKEILSMKKEAMAKPMGLSHAISSTCQPHIDSWLKTYGKNYLQWYGVKAQLIVTEQELIKELLNNKDGSVSKIDNEGFVKKLLGDGLVATKGEKWMKLRKLANYAFHGESLKGMVPAMISSAEMMLQRWKSYEGKEVEVYEEFRLLTSEVISRTAFGSNYMRGKDIFEMLMRLAWLTSKNMYKLRLPGISKFFKNREETESDMLEKKIHNCILEIIKEREKKVRSGEEDNFGNDFLGLLLKAHHDNSDSQTISVDDLIDECKTFYFAGQETSNTLLGWTVFLLAIHTDWQEEVRKEVLNLFGHENPNPDSIAKLKTMGMVFNESLRLYPPVIGFERKVEREVRVGRLILPANLNLIFPTLAVHHDPHIWGEDVNEFKPERFSEGVTEATKNNPAAFFPFGMGLRNCVGSNFAITEAKIALSMILQRYSFTLSPAYVHLPFQFITLHPQHGIQVILQPL